jgi:hypothetical protein
MFERGFLYPRITVEASEMTEQTKNNISPFFFAMMVMIKKKEEHANVGNPNDKTCQAI